MANHIKVQSPLRLQPIACLIPATNLSLEQLSDKRQSGFEVRGGEEQEKKNFKWSYEEHAKYVHFLEMNKQRVKSKLVRNRSNAFFRQMEKYIKTKTSIQCRSHHQKFEEKYKFPHRIITGEKKHIPSSIYQTVLEETLISNYQPQIEHYAVIGSGQASAPQRSVVTKQVSCQTDICDLRLEYLLRPHYNKQQNYERQAYCNFFPGSLIYPYYYPFHF